MSSGENELDRMLRAQSGDGQLERDLRSLLNQPQIPILGQQQPSGKRWQCRRCKAIVPASPQLVKLPDSEPFQVPETLILTILPGEIRPVFLCSSCDVEFRRKLVPPLDEIDEDGNVIQPGLRAVPPQDGDGEPI